MFEYNTIQCNTKKKKLEDRLEEIDLTTLKISDSLLILT